jgi:mono/diheme cytochrome c family protein
MTSLRLLSVAAALAASSLPLAAQTPEQLEMFEKSVRPVFAQNCQTCHNAKLKSGGLDLSSAEGLKEAASGGFFGTAAEPDKSLILEALGYEGRVKMPPPGKLPAGKIAAIRAWVAAGAPTPAAAESSTGVRSIATRGVITEADKNFWAFKPLANPKPPAVSRKDWAANPIDAFVLDTMEKKGLEPASPADKYTLLRRATFDLTGLPPTEKEIADFLADRSPNAFEEVVDRLLASPRYGERWGREWLDVMRYADSTGSDEDHRYPHAWRYRDWVIAAFNKDMPYDQFVREQLAGDILAADPKSGVGYEGIVATGFLALGKKALAQKDLPLKRYDVVDDQIDVTAKALLGLTVTCARCHDHKFDPIATKDYYSMAAIFASTLSYEKGDDGPSVETPLAPVAQYESFKKQWDAVLDLDSKIDKIINFDNQAKKARDKDAEAIPAYMLAAYRVYAKNEASDAVAADTKVDATKLDAAKLARWVAYLKDASRAELKNWRAATDATRRHVAEEYQGEFSRSAYQYDQNLSWWKQARKSYPAAGKVAGPRPEWRATDGPFFDAVWIQNGPMHLSHDDQIATLAADKAASVREMIAQREQLERAAPKQEIPMACAVKEGPAIDQKVFLHGDYHNLGVPAPRAFPAILRLTAPAEPVQTGSGRLELANWIVSGKNPIAARVMANRIWLGHFSEGIVRTPDNFGRLGDRPSNPDLLDYLAQELVNGGWSIKKIHREIMLSRSYQMSAEYDAAKKAADPENRLLSHFPARRLSIEEVRDSYLAMGGDIDFKMGGTLDPGVGTDGETSANRISMNPESTNRRSIYLPLRRSNLPTLFALFDFGDASTPQGYRAATTVATQALFVMNSPMVDREANNVSAAALAQEKKDSRRIEKIYLTVLNRRPDPNEIDAGLTYIQNLRRKWRDFDGPKAWKSYTHALMASNDFIYVY